jgi:DNA-binding NarL/FixJ family response regulator
LRARVLVVDDHAPFLELLSDLLRATDHLEAVGTARSGEQAVELARTLRPDLVLIDFRMPGMDGAEAAKLMKAADHELFVVLVSTAHPAELPVAVQASADAMIWKSELDGRLLDEIWLRHRDRV